MVHPPASRTTMVVLVFSLLAAVAGGSVVAAGSPVDAARDYRGRNGARILADFAELLRIPNIQADQAGLRATAGWIRDALAAHGAESKLLEIDGAPPIVWGRLDAPGAERTLGVYVHYDGQPVDTAAWTTPPFEPALFTAAHESGGKRREFPRPGEAIDPEWRLYARSSGDDKAPVPAILGALDALAAAGIERSSNVVFFFEGEEEAGSNRLGDYLRTNKALLDDIDLWLICDGPVHQSRKPQLVFGVRGYSGFDITVYGAERYLHSGHYGNWAPNPAMQLAELLATFKDADGRVTIEGWLEGTAKITAADRRSLAAVPSVDAALMQELGLARVEGGGASLIERMLVPSLNIRGMQSATVGATARNIVPTRAEATFDIRLAKGNDPEGMIDRVEAHVRKLGYHIVREEPDHATRLAHPRLAKIVRRPGYPAVRTPLDLPVVQPVIAAASAAAGEPVILLPTLGGSLPLYLFTTILDQPLVVVPIANHDDNQHAPDENLRIANLWYGIDLFAALFAMPRAEAPSKAGGR